MTRKRSHLGALSGFGGLFGAALMACNASYYEPKLSAAPELPPTGAATSDIKVHMRSGDLVMMRQWQVDDSYRTIAGVGVLYDASRQTTGQPTPVSLPLDSVALVETNSPKAAAGLGYFGIGATIVAGAALSVTCLADPKSCFGSCPTFYVEGPDSARVRAEGFSASIARVLEASDVDALGSAAPGPFALRMRNEALETHMVRRVELLAVPRHKGERVFAMADSSFIAVAAVRTPDACTAPEGNCLAAVAHEDDRERWSLADSTDLAVREDVLLRFETAPPLAGIVIRARNSLVSTFAFYQTMAYLGRSAGDALAQMERGTREQAEAMLGMARGLGDIEVQVRDASGEWATIGRFGEPGPIASDTKVIPLPARTAAPLDVRLRMARGNWRVDWVAIAELGNRRVPVRVAPRAIERDGRNDPRAMTALSGGGRHLITTPGDEYRIVFDLPLLADSLELFLDSQGFYYEWMRSEWLADENPMMAALLLGNPREGLKRLAPQYKVREAKMEQLFWASRFNRGGSDAARR